MNNKIKFKIMKNTELFCQLQKGATLPVLCFDIVGHPISGKTLCTLTLVWQGILCPSRQVEWISRVEQCWLLWIPFHTRGSLQGVLQSLEWSGCGPYIYLLYKVFIQNSHLNISDSSQNLSFFLYYDIIEIISLMYPNLVYSTK